MVESGSQETCRVVHFIHLRPANCDLRLAPGPLRQPWQRCVGSATRRSRCAPTGRPLERAHRELGFRHVRFHGLLDSLLNADRIFDFLLSIGMKPIVEPSFMPRALSSGNDIVFFYQGNITPPRDPAAWAGLVGRLAVHWVERYGIDEVSSWPFEVWNES